MHRCLILGCSDRSVVAKSDYICRYHWRSGPETLTKAIKRRERQGKRAHLACGDVLCTAA